MFLLFVHFRRAFVRCFVLTFITLLSIDSLCNFREPLVVHLLLHWSQLNVIPSCSACLCTFRFLFVATALCSRIDCTRILISHVAIAHEHLTDSLFLLYTRIECLSKGGDLGQPHRSSDKKEQSCSLGLGLDTWVRTCSIIRMSCLPILDC